MTECTLPPSGWRCTREAGHDGPCAAVPSSPEQGGEGAAAALLRTIRSWCDDPPAGHDAVGRWLSADRLAEKRLRLVATPAAGNKRRKKAQLQIGEAV